MLTASFSLFKNRGLKLLFLGAHCDDIEIGCGGTILRLMEKYEIRQVRWVVLASNEVRKEEARLSAEKFLESVPDFDIDIHDFRDGYLPSIWTTVKDEFEKIKGSFSPDVIFTHYRNDLHQDHRTVNELTWNTFRNHLILEYEIPKYDGDLGNPNLFVPLEADQLNLKNEIILDCFKSQLEKQWFDRELLTSLMRIRGVESASESGYAEAFYCRKIII